MEVELVTESLSDEDTFGVDDNNDDYSTFEGERCGICMDIVIDRGVLDCCQHWFCFACIDNWATITNLCPLCQNEFQVITCVPVYDTIGSNKADEDLDSRDDDWCVEGKNNTLSFPSYYIDENAVICLDGDGCKIRSGSATIEEYSNLDTSIACDSCDIWYHAFCVGFDPEGTCENSWLCPRCEVNEMPPKSDEVQVLRQSNQSGPENVNSEWSVEAAFSGKVSVSVADAGETAVVVSMLDGSQGIGEPNGKVLSSSDACKDLKIDTLVSSSGANNHKLGMPSQVSVSVADARETAVVVSIVEGNQGTEAPSGKFLSIDSLISSYGANTCELETPASKGISIEPNLEAHELELSLSRDKSFSLPNSLVVTEFNTNSFDKATGEQSVFDGFEISSRNLFGKLYDNEPLESSLDLHLGLSVGPSLSVDKMDNKLAENEAGDVQQKNYSEESLLPVDKVILHKEEKVVGITGAKRKRRDWRGAEDGETKARIETKVSAKKVKAEGNSKLIHSVDQADEYVSDDSQKSPTLVAVSKDDKLRCISNKENDSTDIRGIVQGTVRRPLKRLACSNLAESSSRETENAAGLRVKKIMRRTTEDKESSMLVQNLRKEIRDAVRNKSSKEFGDNLFDPKLLAAFRAVVAGTITETSKSPTLDLKAKKSLLQKGKIRESLTKKIYGIGGRRRRAWTRDCEIEFWKHRCLKITKPQKIETLKSVLNLLRTNSESTETKQGNEREATGSILSRLYLADTSVFPRKDDIKPLSALKATGISEQNKAFTSVEKPSTLSLGKLSAKNPQTNEFSSHVSIPSIDNKGTKSTIPSIKCEAASNKVHPSKCPERPSISTLGGSKVNSPKEMVGKSDDRKSDKRKWALEVLARKTAVTGKNAAQEQQEDNAVLKGNYPLLAQLPLDMRPILGPSCHNKIPISVRQAQLHRLTEHLLKKANLPVIRRTGELELAVADAVNIEKEVADRSSSKLIYMNLCSRELLRRADSSISGKATESDPNPTSVVPTDVSEAAINDFSSGSVVDEALRNVGLLSDSPPNSPHHQREEIKEEVDHSNKNKEEGPDNVFEMDCQPELDIYGDFDYDLEDEDFIGASDLKISKQKPGESKMKLVLSTLDSDRSNGACGIEDPPIVGVLKGYSSLLECHAGSNIGSSTVDNRTDKCLPQNSQNSFLDEGEEEPSLAECEELYGPDKEPLIKKFPERASIKPNELAPNSIVLGDSEYRGSNQAVKASELQSESYAENLAVTTVVHHSSGGEDSPNRSQKNVPKKEKMSNFETKKQSNMCNSVSKKVEAYIKEHIRPLCKSGVITVEQYRWAVGKTTDKIMKYHSKDTNANFLVKEGEKVKKLAEQYVETAQADGKT